MSDEEIRKLITEAFLSEESPPLTNEDVDLLLFHPVEEGPPEELERARGEFAAKVLRNEYETPLQQIKSGLSFGQWLKSIREGAGISTKAVAARLEEDETFIHGLESSESHPWDFPLDVIARVMVLFRIHINAIRSLALNALANKTASLPWAHTSISNDASRSSVSMNKWLHDLEQILNNLDAKDLISQ
jgi:transcriptional regulator with XRE-family HTH domain